MVQLMLRTPLQWPLFLHHITMATKTMVAQACKCDILKLLVHNLCMSNSQHQAFSFSVGLYGIRGSHKLLYCSSLLCPLDISVLSISPLPSDLHLTLFLSRSHTDSSPLSPALFSTELHGGRQAASLMHRYHL